eukprot:11271877-Alexandrium_andersonii.AAC.1
MVGTHEFQPKNGWNPRVPTEEWGLSARKETVAGKCNIAAFLRSGAPGRSVATLSGIQARQAMHPLLCSQLKLGRMLAECR